MAADVTTLEEARRAMSDQTAMRIHAPPESLTLDQMIKTFVSVTRGPLIIDIRNTHRRLHTGEFNAAYAHDKVTIDDKAIPVTALWRQSPERMSADCFTFHPGEEQFFMERGLRHLNIWKPPSWPIVDPAYAAVLVEHLAYLIPDKQQRNDLLDWLAHAAQVPHIRPHFHFLLVAPTEGTGRSWLVEILRRVWGERHAGETDLHRLLDDSFNSMLSAKIIVAVHEVKAPADERYSHRDRIKSLLTDTILTVNEKHEPRWTERFCARFLMFTNRDDALPLSETDRRVYAVRCVDAPKDATYYTKLYAAIDDQNVLAAVWQMLRTRDISKFNPGMRAPLNEMKQQMIASGRSDEQQTAVEFAKACPHDVVAAADLMRACAPSLDEERPGDRKSRMAAVAAALRELGAQTSTTKIRIGSDVGRVWILRNSTTWSAAQPKTLKDMAERAHKDLAQYGWLPDAAIEVWTKVLPDVAAVAAFPLHSRNRE